jgi:hypothetical protein
MIIIRTVSSSDNKRILRVYAFEAFERQLDSEKVKVVTLRSPIQVLKTHDVAY